MRFNLRLLLVAVSVLAFTLAIPINRAARQSAAVNQLLNYDFVEIEYSDGEYESTTFRKKRNHLICTVTAVHLDVTWDDPSELIPIIRRFPSLRKIHLSYQGDDERPNKIREKLHQAFPRLDIDMGQYFTRIPVVG